MNLPDPSARQTVVNLDSVPLSWDVRQARLVSHKGMVSLWELQSALQSSILDWAFKGELCPLPVLLKIQPHKERGAGVRILGEGEMESSYHE